MRQIDLDVIEMWFFRKNKDDYYAEDEYDILLYNPDDSEEESLPQESGPVIVDEPELKPMNVSLDDADESMGLYLEDDLPEEPEEPVQKPEKEPVNWRKTLLTFAHDVIYLLAALVVISLVLRVVVVDGTSMNNTLKDGDYLLVLSNIFYRNPKQGDVIVASKDSFDNGAPIVKRVIATEGQKVDIDFQQGIVYVDDEPLNEPYTLTPTNLQEGIEFPLIVGEGCLFVLGDNRNGSKDSRHPSIGLIDKREVIGKVIFLFLPGTNGTDYQGNPRESRDFSRVGAVS